MFKLFNKLFSKNKEYVEKDQLVEQKCKGYSSIFYMPRSGYAFRYGGEIAENYLKNTIIEYLKEKKGIVLDNLNITVIKEKYPMLSYFESVRIEIDSVKNEEESVIIDLYLSEYFERFRFLHCNQRVIKPILDITPLDLDYIGQIEGYVKFEELEDYKKHFKAIKVNMIDQYFNDLDFYLDNRKEVVIHKDLCAGGFYRFTFDLNGDDGFYWKVKFYEKQPIDLSKDYQSIVIEVANKLVCSNYFIGKIE
nr:MAG TPA: hypothetical protein [Caudoviricetes sp.]